MAKKQNQEIQEKNKKTGKILIYILAGVAVILGLLLIATNFYYNDKIINEYSKNPDRDWMTNNCKCIEHNGTESCPAGFVMVDGLCTRNKEVTNKLIACSKYKCPEYIINITENEQ